MWWPFRKKEDVIASLKKSLELSFLNVKKDFESLKTDHHTKISIILDRLDRLERVKLETATNQESSITNNIDISDSTLKIFDSLTDKQKTLCRVVAALNLESPGKWISLKTVSEDLHPNSSYNKVRSNLSEYTSLLEELGFIKKRKKGRQSYIMSTNLNPCLKELQQINKLARSSKKKQDKKSKQS
ncbi:MAG: hypothetical protein AABY07_03070 [Nanoarchaeota archaeon]